MGRYCPRCKSRLYPVDKEPMQKFGCCSYCKQIKEQETRVHRIIKKKV